MKTHTQHTPGLWTVNDGAILCAELNKYGNWIVADCRRERTCEDDANLRLIAAAPELLSALETLCADAEDHLESVGKTYPKAMLTLALIDNARQAISKAKGEAL